MLYICFRNNEEERSSGTTGTGINQKDLQISKRTKEEKDAKNLLKKGRAHCKFVGGGNENAQTIINAVWWY